MELYVAIETTWLHFKYQSVNLVSIHTYISDILIVIFSS